MLLTTALACETLPHLLDDFANLRFSGRLDLRLSQPETTWHLYLRDGQLIHAGGGQLPLRRFRRLFSCEVIRNSDWQSLLSQQNLLGRRKWKYLFLTLLCNQGKLCIELGSALIRAHVLEIFHEIAFEPGTNLQCWSDSTDILRGPFKPVLLTELVAAPPYLQASAGLGLLLLHSCPQFLKEGGELSQFSSDTTLLETAFARGISVQALLAQLKPWLDQDQVQLVPTEDLVITGQNLASLLLSYGLLLASISTSPLMNLLGNCESFCSI